MKKNLNHLILLLALLPTSFDHMKTTLMYRKETLELETHTHTHTDNEEW